MSHESMFLKPEPSYALRNNILPSSVGTLDEPCMLYVFAHDVNANKVNNAKSVLIINVFVKTGTNVQCIIDVRKNFYAI